MRRTHQALPAWLLSARKRSLAKPLSLRFISLYFEPLRMVLLLHELLFWSPLLNVAGVSLVVLRTTGRAVVKVEHAYGYWKVRVRGLIKGDF